MGCGQSSPAVSVVAPPPLFTEPTPSTGQLNSQEQRTADRLALSDFEVQRLSPLSDNDELEEAASFDDPKLEDESAPSRDPKLEDESAPSRDPKLEDESARSGGPKLEESAPSHDEEPESSDTDVLAPAQDDALVPLHDVKEAPSVVPAARASAAAPDSPAASRSGSPSAAGRTQEMEDAEANKSNMDLPGGVDSAVTFMDMGCMLNTLVRIVMATMLATEIENPDQLPASIEEAVESRQWELEEETGFLRSRVLGSILMGYEPTKQENEDPSTEIDPSGMTPEEHVAALMENDAEDRSEEDEEFEDEDGGIEMGGPALFVRGRPTPLPDALLFGDGRDEDEVAVGWLQPYGFNPKPGVKRTNDTNIGLYKKWGHSLATNGPNPPKLGLVLFPTGAAAVKESLVAAEAFLQEVRPILWGLGVGNMIVDSHVAEVLVTAIKESKGLRFLALTFYLGMTVDAMRHLCPAIGKSSSLRILALPGLYIGTAGAEALADAMAGNSSVVSLLMGRLAPIINGEQQDGGIDEDSILGEALGPPLEAGCTALARMMLANSTIRILDMSLCGAGDETAKVLADVLKSNKTLVELFLCHNNIGNDGASAMISAMAHNDTLILLDLHENPQTLVPVEVVDRGDEHAEAFFLKPSEEGKEKWFVPVEDEDDDLLDRMDNDDHDEPIDIADFDARTAPRSNIDRRGMAVVEFMREVGDEGGETMTRLKWFLVGRGEAGKTSLFRTLQNPAKAQLVEKLDRTILMDVEEWKPADREGLHVNVWDCGGQDEYWRVGNQTFLTSRRTLYIVVVDLSYTKPVVVDSSGLGSDGSWGEDKEMFCLKKYVNTLLTHVPSCVLVVVGTKKDKVPDPPDEYGDADTRLQMAMQVVQDAFLLQRQKMLSLEGEFRMRLYRCRRAEAKISDHDDKTKLKGTIKWLEEQLSSVRKRQQTPPVIAADPIAVSCADADAMEGLREKLLDLSLDQNVFRDMASIVPKSWTKLHELVDAQQRAFPLMHWRQFQDVMFERSGSTSLPRFKRAVGFLHSIGVLLHYEHVDNLKDIVVVQPTWLLDAFRQVIRHDFRHIERLGGRMSRFARQLRQEGELSLLLSWGDRVEPSVSTDLLVTLMRQFDLAFPRTKDSYFVPSMCPSMPQPALLDVSWPSNIEASETLLGLSVEMVPAPRGAFERLVARLSDVFHVLEGAWRGSDTEKSIGAGVLIRPRDLDIGGNVLLLVRMDDTGRCVILARQAKLPDISISCASVLCIVEMLAQLLRDAFAGVVSTVTGLLCPHCLRTTEEIGHAVPLESLTGRSARVGSFAVDVVKQFLKGVADEKWDLGAGAAGLHCPSCQKPARSMMTELHGLRMAGRSSTLQMLKDMRARASQQIQAQSTSRKGLARASSLIGRSVPLAAALSAVARRSSLGRALSRKASKMLTQEASNSTLLQSEPTAADKLGDVPVAAGDEVADAVAVQPRSLDAPRTIEESSSSDPEGDAEEVARELQDMRAVLLKTRYEAARAAEDAGGGDGEKLPEISIKLPDGVNGEEQEALYGTFLHPIKPKHAAQADEVTQDLMGPISALLAKGWSPPPLIGSSFYIDFCVRDQQIRAAEAPPMVVISWRKLKELGCIPRSSEGHAVSIAQAMAEVAELHSGAPPPKLMQYEDNPFGGASVPTEFYPHLDSELGTVPRLNLVMVSHRWRRPTFPHPDDEEGTKAKMLVEYGQREFCSAAARETYFWIDFCSVDQNNPWPGIQALPLYISNCAGGMVVVANDEYESRAWCRLEQVLYASFSSKPVFTAVPTPKGVTGTERWLSDWKKKLLDPRKGNLTCEADREVVGELTDLAAHHYGKSWVYAHRDMCKVLKGVNLTASIEFGTTEVALEDHSDYRANDVTGAGPMGIIPE